MALHVADKPFSEQLIADGKTVHQSTSVSSLPSSLNKPERLVSLDAYRGFIMLVMTSAGFGFPQLARLFRDDPFW